MTKDLLLLPRYIKNLGLFSGFVAFLNVELLKRSEFRMPGYAHIIFLRPTTTDRKVFREIFLFNAYGFQTDPPKTIVDGGANIGLSSIFFAKRFPAANIYAIEPEQTNFDVLIKNTTHYPAIACIQTALWYRECFLKISNEKEDHWAFSVEECSPEYPGAFRATSLEALMKENNMESIDLLKLDIEGAERELFFQNYEYWLSRTKVLMIELHDWLKPGSSASFFKAISKYHIETKVHEGTLLIRFNH